MTRRYFGTDGVRGTANKFPMTPDVVLRLGQAAGHYFAEKSPHSRPTVVIGKDTRLSGYMMEAALQAGFTSVGMYCLLLGPMPTPAVAFLTRSLRADLGVMISASHNPFEDNGIKLFGADGFKLPDATELEIETLLDTAHTLKLAEPDVIGKAVRYDDAAGRYIEYCKTSVAKDFDLSGMRVVIDCANGAAYNIAPKILWELGAQVIRVAAEPDGMNINRNCGALHTERMRQAVLDHGADLGIALDGDADRLILCDEQGRILDGDEIMAAIGLHLHRQGRLKGGAIVATQMSNMGLERYLNSHNIGLVRTKVGDRYVMEAMCAGGYNFGGEASGHMICLDHATTGDGVLAALQFLQVMRERGCRASVLGNSFAPFPQKLHNVVLPEKSLADALIAHSGVQESITTAEKELNGNGRVLIRKSGTEALVRVMVEADDVALVEKYVTSIVASMEQHLPSLG